MIWVMRIRAATGTPIQRHPILVVWQPAKASHFTSTYGATAHIFQRNPDQTVGFFFYDATQI